ERLVTAPPFLHPTMGVAAELARRRPGRLRPARRPPQPLVLAAPRATLPLQRLARVGEPPLEPRTPRGADRPMCGLPARAPRARHQPRIRRQLVTRTKPGDRSDLGEQQERPKRPSPESSAAARPRESPGRAPALPDLVRQSGHRGAPPKPPADRPAGAPPVATPPSRATPGRRG